MHRGEARGEEDDGGTWLGLCDDSGMTAPAAPPTPAAEPAAPSTAGDPGDVSRDGGSHKGHGHGHGHSHGHSHGRGHHKDHGAAEPHEPTPALWVERVGDKTYVGRNERGGQVLIGQHGHDGVISPGELLKLALAACSAMSAERPVLRRLGEDLPITAGVSSVKASGDNRYERLITELVLPLAGLSPEDREQVEVIARRAVTKGCTVGRTIEAAAHIDLAVSGEA